MRTHSLLHYAYATVTSIALLGLGPAYAQNLPSYMEPITGRTASSAADAATKNILALNTGMFELYDDAAQIFQRNLLSKHPVILALFSGAGGRFILYRPGQEPLEAPSVPIVYQLLKSIGHSTMALSQVVAPYITIASPSIRQDRGARDRTAISMNGKRCVKSFPWRVISRTPAPSRRARMQKPSCLISCIHPAPDGAL